MWQLGGKLYCNRRNTNSQALLSVILFLEWQNQQGQMGTVDGIFEWIHCNQLQSSVHNWCCWTIWHRDIHSFLTCSTYSHFESHINVSQTDWNRNKKSSIYYTVHNERSYINHNVDVFPDTQRNLLGPEHRNCARTYCNSRNYYY